MSCWVVDSSAFPDSPYGKKSPCCKGLDKEACLSVVIAPWFHLLLFGTASCKLELCYPLENEDEIFKGLRRASALFRVPAPSPGSSFFSIVKKFRPLSTPQRLVKEVRKRCKLKEEDSRYVALLLAYDELKDSVLITCDNDMYECKAKLQDPPRILTLDEVVRLANIQLPERGRTGPSK